MGVRKAQALRRARQMAAIVAVALPGRQWPYAGRCPGCSRQFESPECRNEAPPAVYLISGRVRRQGIGRIRLNEIMPKRFIFDELVSAGLVGLLGPEGLQEMASDYYLLLDANVRQMAESLPYRDILRGTIPYAVQAQIRARCGDRSVYRGQQVIGFTLPVRCSLGLNGAQIDETVAHVRSVPELDADLTRYLSALDQKVGLLQGTAQQSDELAAALRAF